MANLVKELKIQESLDILMYVLGEEWFNNPNNRIDEDLLKSPQIVSLPIETREMVNWSCGQIETLRELTMDDEQRKSTQSKHNLMENKRQYIIQHMPDERLADIASDLGISLSTLNRYLKRDEVLRDHRKRLGK